MHITTIGLDLAKHWFQIHGVDAAVEMAVKRRLRRTEGPSMRFVLVKNVDQQSVPRTRRARNLLTRQRTTLVNALRAYLAEFGVIAPQGLRHVA